MQTYFTMHEQELKYLAEKRFKKLISRLGMRLEVCVVGHLWLEDYDGNDWRWVDVTDICMSDVLSVQSIILCTSNHHSPPYVIKSMNNRGTYDQDSNVTMFS